ncbi:hypothetical protein SAMN05216436_1176 [bacterium A37T11]|nr:hypothetical protein SAMN05216436_1176 [bacterium A37T11]
MYSSQNKDILFLIYGSEKSIFTLTDVAMLAGEADFGSLNKKLNYYVHQGKLQNPVRGIYAKSGYKATELCCRLYTPSYISLEYVLQQAGIIFQYDERITAISYLSRNLEIAGQTYKYRKIKGEILICTQGIQQINQVNIATPERAFLDLMYLNSHYYFDNISPLNKELVEQLLEIYQNKRLSHRVHKLLSYG